ncbi:Fucose-1-phosphate guanylyltransferase [Geodia barretti]|uniref:Fucose-1-phosphate guanylyltransferase n=1 Tax=Geodia barretti TaxID=519541 RepID=A0AA35T4F6_GEOBA|nr:Fucose-1-phosphate guanylyltransferase [Geodia barretti]
MLILHRRVQLLQMTLVDCTREKFSKYEQLLNDAGQKYIVISDPPGVKVGSGGSTLHCLEYLANNFGQHSLSQWKVLIIHAGGFSQRFPSQSVLGKVFLTLPCSKYPIQMLEALLMMYISIPGKMNYGVFIAASDVIFLFNEKGNWDFRVPGFVAIAHPASLKLAKNHGVFILEDMISPWGKYRSDPSSPAMVATPKCFLHKQTAEVLKHKGAVIPDSDLIHTYQLSRSDTSINLPPISLQISALIHPAPPVYVDLAFYFDVPTALKLIQFYAGVKPLKCELEAYADFLQPLGSASSVDYYEQSSYPEKARVQQKLFGILNGTPFKVVIFHEAQFNHLGTISEYLHHICGNATLRSAYQFANHHGTEYGDAERLDCSLIHSVLGERSCIEAGTVIEYCILEEGVSIGRNCLLSNLHVPMNAVIPSNTFIHTVTLLVQHEVLYATCVFGVNDDLKRTLPRSCAFELEFLNLPLTSVLGIGTSECTTDDLWPANGDCNLWTAKLFPACSSRKQSCEAALLTIAAIKENGLFTFLRGFTVLVSMEDVMVLKTGTSMLDFQLGLQSKMLS